MSNPVTALNGRSAKGFVSIKDAGLTGMITLRGDLGSAAIAKAVKTVSGAKIPTQGQVEQGTKGSVGWMSPDELLLITDYSTVTDQIARIEKDLSGNHFLAANVSDARAVIDLMGKDIRDVLAKGSPADVAVESLPVGSLRRTRLGQLPVAFWFEAEDHARLVCFRSVGQHVFDWLENAALLGTRPTFHT